MLGFPITITELCSHVCTQGDVSMQGCLLRKQGSAITGWEWGKRILPVPAGCTVVLPARLGGPSPCPARTQRDVHTCPGPPCSYTQAPGIGQWQMGYLDKEGQGRSWMQGEEAGGHEPVLEKRGHARAYTQDPQHMAHCVGAH